MMTVAELIEKLQQLDPSLRVLVDGYESGYEEPKFVFVEDFRMGVNSNGYESPHVLASDGYYEREYPGKTVEACAVLPHRLYSFTGEM